MTHHNFSEPNVMSLNVLLWPTHSKRPKIFERKKHQILTLDKKIFWHFSFIYLSSSTNHCSCPNRFPDSKVTSQMSTLYMSVSAAPSQTHSVSFPIQRLWVNEYFCLHNWACNNYLKKCPLQLRFRKLWLCESDFSIFWHLWTKWFTN